MNTTFEGDVFPYLGIDLTDRYSKSQRPVDVCGLRPSEGSKLHALFWCWEWGATPGELDVTTILRELKATRAVMIDGPQGLATKGNDIRVCERQAAAAGKTPDVRPSLNRPFAGFICSSLDLFSALSQAGMTISPPGFRDGVSEVYPGHIWRILAGRVLPKKSTYQGRLARKRILEVLGVSGLPELPTHDQIDACVAALLAAAADEDMVPGLTLKGIGVPLSRDPDGTLREGPMAIPELTAEESELISQALSETFPIVAAAIGRKKAVTSLDPGNSADLAESLLDDFITTALKGNPQVCTYSWAYRRLFRSSYDRWSQAFANQVIKVAQHTPLRELPGLGAVQLDGFIVAKNSGFPSDGHWESAHYEREDWERVLGSAEVLHSVRRLCDG